MQDEKGYDKMKTIDKTELASMENPADGWYIIEAAGEHPKSIDLDNGRRLSFTQKLTTDALARIADTPIPPEGILIDYDHKSLTENSTCAMGWVKELALCDGDLAARIEWTSVGLAAVRDKQFKHFSTVYPAQTEEALRSGVYEPQQLNGLALTNCPNNADGQPPITNCRAVGGDNFQPQYGAAVKNKHTDTTMKYNPELLALLSLADGATDEEVLEAVRKLVADRDAAQADAVNAAAEAVINSEEAKEGAELTEEERKDCKEAVIANSVRGVRYTQMLCREKKAAKAAAATPAQHILNSRNYPGVPNTADNLLFARSNAGAVAQASREQRSKAQQILDAAHAAGRRMTPDEAWTRAGNS